MTFIEAMLLNVSGMLSHTVIYLGGFAALCMLVWITNKWTGIV